MSDRIHKYSPVSGTYILSHIKKPPCLKDDIENKEASTLQTTTSQSLDP